MKETWYLLFDGLSVDGRGSPNYVGRTTDKNKAKAHYDTCRLSPYCTGKVIIITDKDHETAWLQTDWDSLS